MRKKVQKIIAFVLLVAMSVSMVACGTVESGQVGSNNTDENVDVEEIDTLRTLSFYKDFYSDGFLTKMSNEKNKDYEMEVGVYNSYDEMLSEYIKTFVSIKTDFYDSHDQDDRFAIGSGNIYDIDDEYMYIITCMHITSNSKNDIIKSFYIRFVDDERITISADNLFRRDDDIDIALIRIPLSEIPQSTLDVVKTINIDNAYNIALDEFYNSTLYCYRYRDKIYNVSYVKNIQHRGMSFVTKDNNIEKGTSGGGVIDINGNYYTLMLSEGSLCLQMLYYFNDLLVVAKQ